MNLSIQRADTPDLLAAENRILNTMSVYHNYMERQSIIDALKVHGNAEKVVRVLELNGGFQKPQGATTLYPIITRIGDRTAEQYVEDVRCAVERFNAAYRQYVQRFEVARTEKERVAAVHWWMDYLGAIK